MIELSKVRVSMFANATGRKPSDRYLCEVLDEIRTGKYAAKIADLRRLLPQDRKRYDAKKTTLPAFTASGTAKNRKELGQHSGLLQVDLDKLGDGLTELRQRLRPDPHVAFGFVSPSGDGLKLGVVIDPTRHEESFVAAESFFLTVYKAKIDRRCKDRLRLCFVSHDPGLWINKSAVVLPITSGQQGEVGIGDSPKSYVLNHCVTESLNHCISTSQSTREMTILGSIAAKKAALQVLEKKSPVLAALYLKLVEPRYQAMPGGRNNFIVEAVPFLYRAVAESLVSDLIACFYDANRTLFNDSREEHMRQAAAHLKAVAQTYLNSLSEGERKVYLLLNQNEQDAFRICRDLALRPEPEYGPLTFFMSFNELGARVGVHPMLAQRIMRQFAIYRLLLPMEKGTRRAPGVRAVAGVYRWQLEALACPNLLQQ